MAKVGVNKRRLKRVLIEPKIIENFQNMEKELNSLEEAIKEQENLNPLIPFSIGKVYVIYKNLAELLRIYE